MDTQQLIDGIFQPKEICEYHAQRIWREREDMDTNPHIVRMRHLGQLIDHWYYRSDQWIDQPYASTSRFLQPYVGPVESAPPWYHEGSYELEPSADKIMEMGLDPFS